MYLPLSLSKDPIVPNQLLSESVNSSKPDIRDVIHN